jgi:hypothetical protein
MLEATRVYGTRYAVRPEGRLGTCGWVDGKAWVVIYVDATSEEAAIRKARTILSRPIARLPSPYFGR